MTNSASLHTPESRHLQARQRGKQIHQYHEELKREIRKLVHAGSVQDDHQDLEGGLQH